MTRLVLAMPDLNKEFRVEADASNFATEGVLSMKCEDDLWRPVAFISKSLNKTKQNYEIHDKEMLGVIRCLEAWRYFLEGARSKFEIWTNHKNLEYFITSQNLNCRQAKWALYLSRFNFMLKHILGSKIEKTDSLSRRSNWEKRIERNNKERVLLKPKQLDARMGEVIIEGVNILEKIRKSEAKNDEVIKVVEEMKKAGVKMLRNEK